MTSADPLTALLAAPDLDTVEALREDLSELDGTTERVQVVLEEWSDPHAVGNLLLCADLVVPPALGIPAVERAVAPEQEHGWLAAYAAVGAQRMADADVLDEASRTRLVAALAAAARERRDRGAARAGYALIALAEPADAASVLPLADSDDASERHNAVALLLELLGVRGLLDLVDQVTAGRIADDVGAAAPGGVLGGALQVQVALIEAGVDPDAPDEAALPAGHPLRGYVVPALPASAG